jgi:HEAT repeat protein
MMRSLVPAGLALLLCAGCTTDTVGDALRDLDAADAASRKRGAEHLVGQSDPRIAAALARATRDPHVEVRCAAATALATQPANEAIAPLLEMLAARKPGHDCTFEPLGRLQDARAAAPLLADPLRRKDARVLQAVSMLGPGALGPLVDALRTESDPQQAERLARAIGATGGTQARDALVALFAEFDRLAKSNAVMAMGVLGDPASLPLVTKAAEDGIGTAPVALARIGGAGLDDLVARLDHRLPYQRAAAATALAQARDPALVAVLDKGLSSESTAKANVSARLLLQLAGASPDPAAPPPDPAMKAAAEKTLEAAWQRGDLRTIAYGIEYFLARHPDDDEVFLETISAHGDERLAAAYIASPSELLRAAGEQWRREHPAPVAATP